MNNEIICMNSESAKHRLILLHGWGADSEDLIPLSREIISTNKFPIDVVSLSAPRVHPQGFGRMWYSLFPPDWESVPLAVNDLENRLKDIADDRIPLSRTVVLGFSQGGAMALEMGSRLPICGVIACSSYPHPGWMPHKKMSPVFLTHGKEDEIVPCSAAEKTMNLLKQFDVDSDMFIFKGGHQIPDILIGKFQLKLNSWFV